MILSAPKIWPAEVAQWDEILMKPVSSECDFASDEAQRRPAAGRHCVFFFCLSVASFPKRQSNFCRIRRADLAAREPGASNDAIAGGAIKLPLMV